METNTTPDYERGLTFEKVWASIQELRKSQAEEAERWRGEAERRREEAEQEAKLRKEEAEREAKLRKEEDERWREEAERRAEQQAKETAKWKADFDRMVRRSNKQLGELHRRFGQLAEHLVAPNIYKRFNERGYHFNMYASKGARIDDENGRARTEIDILLENGETLMAVEVKAKPAVKDVEHHIRRLEILREFRCGLNDNRKIQGAIAGAIFGTAEKKATIEAGLYVIEQSGDTMRIDVPEGFVPREW